MTTKPSEETMTDTDELPALPPMPEIWTSQSLLGWGIRIIEAAGATEGVVLMPIRCVGCGMEFTSGEAFDLHATGKRRSSLSNPRKCRTVEQMRLLGLKRNQSGYWSIRPNKPAHN